MAIKVNIDKNGDINNFRLMLNSLEQDTEVSSVLILACEGNGFNPANCDQILKSCKKPVFGGIFPFLLTESEKLSRGTILVGLTQEVKPLIFKEISTSSQNFDQIFDNFLLENMQESNTIFLFVDGMSCTIAPLLDVTFNHHGLRSNYIGGGAGSSEFKPIPCIFTSEGLLMDAAILGFSPLKSGVGVAHGWNPVSRTLKVTEADHNSVISFDWKPALQIYKEIIGEVSGKAESEIKFEEIADSYPLGILKVADELLVRDPVKTTGTSLNCLGEMPANAFVYVLSGNVDTLLNGTSRSRENALKAFQSAASVQYENEPITFFIDCITRAGFLKDRFQDELSIASGGSIMIGALSLGEIANSKNDYLEFYNKTSVIGILEN